MRKRSTSIGRIATMLVFSLACVSAVSADNILSGSGRFNATFGFDNTRETGGGSIMAFGPNSLNSDYGGSFTGCFSSYSETPLGNGQYSLSATIGSGNLQIIDLGNYRWFYGSISSGTLSGYYCPGPFPLHECSGWHDNGHVETTVHFSGNWIVDRPFPNPPEYWPAQGYFHIEEDHWYGQWQNNNGVSYPIEYPSIIWMDTQMHRSTPEPITGVLLG